MKPWTATMTATCAECGFAMQADGDVPDVVRFAGLVRATADQCTHSRLCPLRPTQVEAKAEKMKPKGILNRLMGGA